MPFWKRRPKTNPTASECRDIARTRGLTQEEQDAIWNDTQNCLRDIASSCRSRAGSWTEVARKADKVLWLISGTNQCLSNHPGRNADDGSTERLNFLTKQMVQYLEINFMVTDMTFEVNFTLLGIVRDANYQVGDNRLCHPGTQQNVLTDIERWAGSTGDPPVYWLKGCGWAGKSTVARTIAEKTTRNGTLGASFFCSRYYEGRSNILAVFPSLAFQLARKYPEFRSALALGARKEYPTLADQVEDLIIRPFKKCGITTMIIIDGLDDCAKAEPAVSALGQCASEIPNVKFFVTSRPTESIRNEFELLDQSRVHTFVVERGDW